MQAEAMPAYTRSLLEPLVALVGQQEAAIRDQAEHLGRQSAELERAASIAVKLSDDLDAARAQISTLEARIGAHVGAPTTESSPSPGRVWWFWLVLLAPVNATTIVVIIMLLVAPR
jgi:hypothetical protein